MSAHDNGVAHLINVASCRNRTEVSSLSLSDGYKSKQFSFIAANDLSAVSFAATAPSAASSAAAAANGGPLPTKLMMMLH